MTVHVEGSGPAIVILQGGPGLSSHSVAPIVNLLQDNFRVIRCEQTGWTVTDVIRQLDAVRLETGEESWFILGHSWGAGIAALYARQHPERVRGLILVHPLEISSAFCDPAGEAPSGDEACAFEHDADVAEMLWEDLEAMCPDEAGEGYDLAPVAREITAPSLVVLGASDAIDRRSGQLWAELVKAQLISLPDSGHWSFVERPAEFQQAVSQFLLRHAGPRVVAATAGQALSCGS